MISSTKVAIERAGEKNKKISVDSAVKLTVTIAK